MDAPTRDQLAGVIDHTNLYPEDGSTDIDRLCEEAKEYGFGAVCVYGSRVAEAKEFLGNRYGEIEVASVVGFPNGQEASEVKACEAEKAVAAGAHEIDMVINQGYLKEGRFDDTVADIRAVREAVPDATLKVICENCNLTEEEKQDAYRAAVEAGADFIKTSTGFGDYGARVEDVELMAETLDELGADDVGIKASGGVGTVSKAIKMCEAADRGWNPNSFRIGASSGDEIVERLDAL